jgi:hypothetical protein
VSWLTVYGLERVDPPGLPKRLSCSNGIVGV